MIFLRDGFEILCAGSGSCSASGVYWTVLDAPATDLFDRDDPENVKDSPITVRFFLPHKPHCPRETNCDDSWMNGPKLWQYCVMDTCTNQHLVSGPWASSATNRMSKVDEHCRWFCECFKADSMHFQTFHDFLTFVGILLGLNEFLFGFDGRHFSDDTRPQQIPKMIKFCIPHFRSWCCRNDSNDRNSGAVQTTTGDRNLVIRAMSLPHSHLQQQLKSQCVAQHLLSLNIKLPDRQNEQMSQELKTLCVCLADQFQFVEKPEKDGHSFLWPELVIQAWNLAELKSDHRMLIPHLIFFSCFWDACFWSWDFSWQTSVCEPVLGMLSCPWFKLSCGHMQSLHHQLEQSFPMERENMVSSGKNKFCSCFIVQIHQVGVSTLTFWFLLAQFKLMLGIKKIVLRASTFADVVLCGCCLCQSIWCFEQLIAKFGDLWFWRVCVKCCAWAT